MRAAALGLGLATLAALAGCDDSVQFRLRIEWKRASPEDSSQACPTVDGRYSCDAIGISCNAMVRVRIVGATNDEVYYKECFPLTHNGTACELATLPIVPHEIPNEMVRVQVIVWTEQELKDSHVDLSGTDGCPVTTPFALTGLPRLTQPPTEGPPGDETPREPVPALGGEEYFQVGQSPVATVTLGCGQWDSLDALVCRDNSVSVSAAILDPKNGLTVSRTLADEKDMKVALGKPEDNGAGGVRVDTETFGIALDFTKTGPLLWEAVAPTLPVDVVCLRAEANNTGKTITCFDAPATDETNTIHPVGYLIGRNTFNAMLTLIGPPNALPEQGAVLGVVLDVNGQPVPGATVTGAGATIIYPGDTDETFPAIRTDTGAKGYFFSPDAPYDTQWTADGPGSLVDDGTARGGLVDNHATLVVVRLNGALPPVAADSAARVPGDNHLETIHLP